MSAYWAGQNYMKRFDNPPSLVQALGEWGFPADFDPVQLPTGMFLAVLDAEDKITGRQPLTPRKSAPPPPPPTRIGDRGDTMGPDGVRVKAPRKTVTGHDLAIRLFSGLLWFTGGALLVLTGWIARGGC